MRRILGVATRTKKKCSLVGTLGKNTPGTDISKKKMCEMGGAWTLSRILQVTSSVPVYGTRLS